MPACLIVADAPTTLLEGEGEAPARSKIQIAKTGKFKDPRYGSFAITRADIAAWVKNFHKLHGGEGRAGLPLDVDHGPEKNGNTEAAGWMVELDTSKPDELWAWVEWTTLGEELVREKRYRYISPSYSANYVDEQGKQHGTALVGAALTNRPFLTMAAVTLSASMEALATCAVEVHDERPYSPPQTMTLSELAKKLGLDENADEATILSAASAKLDAEPAKPAEDVTLEQRAASEGKVVLDSAQLVTLTAQAAAGAQAAVTLAANTYESKWDKALSEGRAVPAMRENFDKLHEINAEATLAAIDSLPQILNVELGGSGAGGGEDAGGFGSVTLGDETVRVDNDRAALDRQVTSLMAKENIDYGVALERVLAGTEA
jgi:phage I-like protein